jgi:hypothetical protein
MVGQPMMMPRRWARAATVSLLAAVLAAAWACLAAPHPAQAVDLPPLKVEILDARKQRAGRANVYLNYVELLDNNGVKKGAIGVVLTEGRASLFLVQADESRKLIGFAEDHRLYDAQNKLVGYYAWTPIWSYVYDEKLKKVGEAQCIAYQGVCAAGIAGYLLGLF